MSVCRAYSVWQKEMFFDYCLLHRHIFPSIILWNNISHLADIQRMIHKSLQRKALLIAMKVRGNINAGLETHLIIFYDIPVFLIRICC